jgi:hypothetical protein
MTAPPDSSSNAEQRMLGAVPDEPALGRGPAPGKYSRHDYHHPAAATATMTASRVERPAAACSTVNPGRKRGC